MLSNAVWHRINRIKLIVFIKKMCYIFLDANGQLTQLVECLLDVQEVRGSSPLLPITINVKIKTRPCRVFAYDKIKKSKK